MDGTELAPYLLVASVFALPLPNMFDVSLVPHMPLGGLAHVLMAASSRNADSR